jgi:hypothetical protein
MAIPLRPKHSAAQSNIALHPQGLTLLGGEFWSGLYVLLMIVERRLNIFLRRAKSDKVDVPPGAYTYAGSAFGSHWPLPRRFARHSSRSGQKRPHAIREKWLMEFAELGLGDVDLLPKRGKPPRIYNVDHLLDETAVELVAAYALRLPDPGTYELRREVEGQLGRLLMDDPATAIIVPGLGAQDYKKRQPGKDRQTHLLRVDAGDGWWDSLAEKLHQFCEKQMAKKPMHISKDKRRKPR